MGRILGTVTEASDRPRVMSSVQKSSWIRAQTKIKQKQPPNRRRPVVQLPPQKKVHPVALRFKRGVHLAALQEIRA